MAFLDRIGRVLTYATLERTRRLLVTRGGRAMAIFFASTYALVSMLIGQMLLLYPNPGRHYAIILWTGNGSEPWNFPALLVSEGWGVLALPFFATIAMVAVSIGVGIGGSAGVLLALPLLRRRQGLPARSASAGVSAGVAPAVTGLATLGACCCTSCAGITGVAVVAAASGTSLNAVLLQNWYIGLFQMGVVYVALLSQERILRLPAGLYPPPPPLDRRFLAGALLRLSLLIAGITWSLAMLVEWGDTSPLTAAPPIWYHWIFEHQLLALTAISAGLFPKEFAEFVRRLFPRLIGSVGRIALGIAGITWGIWVPPALVVLGLGGFGNELLGILGAPAFFGAGPVDASLGLPLYFHWAFQHLLLSAFALTLAVAPTLATAPLLWTVGRSPFDRSARPAEPGDPRRTPSPTHGPTVENRIPSVSATSGGVPDLRLGPRGDVAESGYGAGA